MPLEGSRSRDCGAPPQCTPAGPRVEQQGPLSAPIRRVPEFPDGHGTMAFAAPPPRRRRGTQTRTLSRMPPPPPNSLFRIRTRLSRSSEDSVSPPPPPPGMHQKRRDLPGGPRGG